MAAGNVTVKVIDSASQLSVSGATIILDGISRGTTDVNGTVTFSLTPRVSDYTYQDSTQRVTLIVKATNYSTYTQVEIPGNGIFLASGGFFGGPSGTLITTVAMSADTSSRRIPIQVVTAGNSPVSGAKVYSHEEPNGKLVYQGQTYNGSLTLQVTGESQTLSISAAGYELFDTQFATPSTNSLVAVLVPTNAKKVKLSVTATSVDTTTNQSGVSPLTDGQITISQSGVPLEYIHLDIKGTGQTLGGEYVVGSIYDAIVAKDGYQTLSQTFTVTPTGEQVFGPVSLLSDGGLSGSSSNPPGLDPQKGIDAAALVASTVKLDPPEYIYPNSSFGKYFTATQARMYIGDIFIDELNSVQFVVQENAVPVYGYSSRFADAFARGRSLVQGQIMINFVSEGYLPTVLSEYRKIARSIQQVPQDSSLSKDEVEEIKTLTKSWHIATTSGKSEEAAALYSKLETYVRKTPQATELINSSKRQLTSYNPIDSLYGNAVYKDIPFDVVIELGDDMTRTKVTRRLESCKLISNEQVLDQSGQAVTDVYGFIARRMR